MSSAALAEESEWDSVLQKATPRYHDRCRQWVQRHKRYDCKCVSSQPDTKDGSGPKLGNSPIDMTDEVRLELVKKLKCNPAKTAADAMEEDGHASAHTGMPEKSVNTLATEGNEINQTRKQPSQRKKMRLIKPGNKKTWLLPYH